MPKVNVEQLEKAAEIEQKNVLDTQIVDKVIGSKKIFKGPFVDDWFDDYGECLNANASAKRVKELDKLGLDEYGRTPELIALSEAKAKLLQKKADILKEVKKIDDEIRGLNPEDFKKSAKKAK